MMEVPAFGERTALRGYRWQYDHIASRVYNALLDGDLKSLRLTDPEAGRVDDLLLIRRGRVDCYQFRSVEHDRALTFRKLIGNQRTKRGKTALSLLRSLADDWSRLRDQWNNLYVHLVTQQFASVHDHVTQEDDPNKPSPDHFSAFLAQVLEPLRSGKTTLDEVDAGWQSALVRLRESSGLSLEEFRDFLQSLYIDVAAGSGLPTPPSTAHLDVVKLSSTLLRLVSSSRNVVVLSSGEVLSLMGWQDRPRLRSRHEFPIDLDTYEPLSDAIEQLKGSIACHDRGYFAVIGPPGCGKSTLLSQALSGSADRVLRYYSYVPGIASTRTRMSGHSFLHDVVFMLAEGGNSGHRRELPSKEIDSLRLQFTDQLDAAGAEFQRTSRRTIIVVDGLDHVDRDYSGSDSLLGELPRPNELPAGVLFIVGSRTLDPLHAHARQQLHERRSTVDLRQHRLLPASILKICRRVPFTTSLTEETHQRIVELCDGHPLALSYLLNRLRETDGRTGNDALSELPAYGGDVEAEYLAVWDEVKDDRDIVEILGICSRLRIAFRTEWIAAWAASAAVAYFRRKLLYLFRKHHDGWRFFHDSFRQFASDRTAWGDETRADERVDAEIHSRIAELCAKDGGGETSSEQLYHCYRARQYEKVLSLAQQRTFREQYGRLRSPDLIRADIEFALGVAASRADVLAVFRLLLAHVEVTKRTSALDEVDMPGVLYAAGLVDEAISWCVGHGRHLSATRVYALAAKLGWDENPAGRQLFDMIEHKGFADEGGVHGGGPLHDAALAWIRAAVLFRPLPAIITGIRNVVQSLSKSNLRGRLEHDDRWDLYERMTRTLIDCVALQDKQENLEKIDSALSDHTKNVIQIETRPEQADATERSEKARNRSLAILLGLRVRAQTELLELAKTGEGAEYRLQKLSDLLQGQRVPVSTLLAISELCYRYDNKVLAAQILRSVHYNHQLTVRDLSFGGEVDAIERRFRYWRLNFLLASKEEDVPESIPPVKDTPAGNDVAPGAPVHSDVDSIDLTGRIDAAVRRLAQLDARIASGQTVLPFEVRAALTQAIHVFQPVAGWKSSIYRQTEGAKHELMKVVVALACQCGGDIPQWLVTTLTNKFEQWPEGWPRQIRLFLADELRFAGARVLWYQETLSAMERNARTESVDLRLSYTADLLLRNAEDGEIESARRLAYELIPMAFGVGYRKDYQFSVWVDWLKEVLAEPGGDRFVGEAAWLAHLMSASDKMSERASALAATELPSAVVPADPVSAVRIFEFLVRQGTVSHSNALASLVQALLTHVDAGQTNAMTLATDIIGDLIAPAANRAYPDLAKALVETATATLGRAEANILAKSVAERTDKYALATTRREWRRGLGLAIESDKSHNGVVAQSNADEFGALELSDGQRISRKDVAGRIDCVNDIVALREAEAESSIFDWSAVLDGMTLRRDEIKALSNVFGYDGYRCAEVQVLMAEAAQKSGERDLALRLANGCLGSARGETWARYFGGCRLRAAKIVTELGDDNARVEACENLAHQIASSPELSGLLISDLRTMAKILDPRLCAATLWPEIRTFLDGMAESLNLPEIRLLADRRCRWWLVAPTGDQREEGGESTVSAALAELGVGHLSHVAWLIRDAATKIVLRALGRGDEEVASALGRFAQAGASDDILERAGHCLAGARVQYDYAPSTALEPLEQILANHPSQIIRGLACDQSPRGYRALSPVYRLALPSPANDLIGTRNPNLWTFEEDYRMLANFLQLDFGTFLAIATRYASDALATLPEQEAIQSALERSHMKHAYPSFEIDAARAAFGRILAEVVDARLLDDAPPRVCAKLLRTIDPDMIGRSPEARPPVIPGPPIAGHDQTIERWRVEIEDRLEEYIASSVGEGCVLVGARCRLTVLNWGHLEEEFTCETTVGASYSEAGNRCVYRNSAILKDLAAPVKEIPAENGTPLLFENNALRFHQAPYRWISFRPGLARTLAWTSDEDRPGAWSTETGEPAVQMVWWMDGWWGRFERAFDDTDSEGHAVILTSTGMADLVDKFGDVTRHFGVTRCGRDDGARTDPVSTQRSLQFRF
ncbi:MAG: ATP-binding protein [Bryobacterales bacterium]|nr:ATP-binding protein [Bryobacterales bacterium]